MDFGNNINLKLIIKSDHFKNKKSKKRDFNFSYEYFKDVVIIDTYIVTGGRLSCFRFIFQKCCFPIKSGLTQLHGRCMYMKNKIC